MSVLFRLAVRVWGWEDVGSTMEIALHGVVSSLPNTVSMLLRSLYSVEVNSGSILANSEISSSLKAQGWMRQDVI